MAASQRFSIRSEPGLPGEYVCAGCGASMVLPEAGPGPRAPEPALEMTHGKGCPEVSNLTREGA
jgi:hypothetical protein